MPHPDDHPHMPDATKAVPELPRYRCHKEVGALKIANIVTTVSSEFLGSGETKIEGALIYPAEPGYAPVSVDADYILRHKPEIGGYLVVYADGYKSFSPAKAFEEGYTRLREGVCD